MNDECWITEYQADINAASNITGRLDPCGERVLLENQQAMTCHRMGVVVALSQVITRRVRNPVNACDASVLQPPSTRGFSCRTLRHCWATADCLRDVVPFFYYGEDVTWCSTIGEVLLQIVSTVRLRHLSLSAEFLLEVLVPAVQLALDHIGLLIWQLLTV